MANANPSVRPWKAAWSEANYELLPKLYHAQSIVLPPNHDFIQGRAAILEFFRGGMGQIDVRFFSEVVQVADTLAIEHGIVRDLQRNTNIAMEVCHDFIVWALEAGEWKIKFHTWTTPIEA